MNVTIQAYVPTSGAHRNAVQSIVSACTAGGRVTLKSREALVPDPELPDGVQAWVASLGDEIVGYTAIDLVSSLTVVHPKYHNMGVGTALMRHKNRQRPPYISTIGATNIASIKAAIKAGLQLFDIEEDDFGRALLLFQGGSDGKDFDGRD